MKIIKGLDRIALVIAIASVIPAFIWGTVLYFKIFGNVTPEYEKWNHEYNERLNYLIKEELKRNPPPFVPDPPPIEFDKHKLSKITAELTEKHQRELDEDEVLKELMAKKPERYQYKLSAQIIAVGIGVSLVSFIVVLFSIRGATRFIKWFSTLPNFSI